MLVDDNCITSLYRNSDVLYIAGRLVRFLDLSKFSEIH